MDRIIKSHERDSSFLTSQITKLTKKNNELEDRINQLENAQNTKKN